MKPRNADQFIAAPPAGIRAVLLYGPDEGLVRERAETLARQIVPDLADPFAVVSLGSAKIAAELALVLDEMSAQSLMGGRRLVRIRDAAEGVTPSIQNALTNLPGGDSFLIVEAGDLRPASPLRKLFEADDAAAALPCYEADTREMQRLAETALKEAGISASRDALQLLATLLASDRGVARRELEKLVTYAGTGGRLDYDDVAAAIGDSATLELDAPAFAAAAGNPVLLDRALTRLFGDGLPPVAVLRAAQRHFQRLYAVVGSDQPLGAAMDALKPPVFWKDRERFAKQAGLWRQDRLERALERLRQAEVDCKTTGLPDTVMCARALLAIAGLVRA